jgi:hypothetical protein
MTSSPPARGRFRRLTPLTWAVAANDLIVRFNIVATVTLTAAYRPPTLDGLNGWAQLWRCAHHRCRPLWSY